MVNKEKNKPIIKSEREAKTITIDVGKGVSNAGLVTIASLIYQLSTKNGKINTKNG